MTVWASLRARPSTWIDDVAAGLTLLGTMLRRSHRIELVEQADGSFLVVDMSKEAAERADGPSLRIDESGIADPISPQTSSLLARSTVESCSRRRTSSSGRSSCPRVRASFSMASSALKSIV